jgi:hypothetical protein
VALLHPDIPWLLKVAMALVEAWQDTLEPQKSPMKQDDSLKLECINILSVKQTSATNPCQNK